MWKACFWLLECSRLSYRLDCAWVKSLPYDQGLAESCLQRGNVSVTLPLPEEASLQPCKDIRPEKSPPDSDNRTDPSLALNYPLSPLTPFTPALSPLRSDWFSWDKHTGHAINATRKRWIKGIREVLFYAPLLIAILPLTLCLFGLTHFRAVI